MIQLEQKKNKTPFYISNQPCKNNYNPPGIQEIQILVITKRSYNYEVAGRTKGKNPKKTEFVIPCHTDIHIVKDISHTSKKYEINYKYFN